MSKFKRFSWAITLSLLLWPFGFSLLSANNKARIILTAKEYAISSDKSFSPLGKINGTVILPAPIRGVHTLESTWFGPTGLQNHFKSTVDFSSQPQQTLSVWLDLGSESGILSSLRDQESVNPEHMGNWVVRVFLDGQEIVSEKFLVD